MEISILLSRVYVLYSSKYGLNLKQLAFQLSLCPIQIGLYSYWINSNVRFIRVKFRVTRCLVTIRQLYDEVKLKNKKIKKKIKLNSIFPSGFRLSSRPMISNTHIPVLETEGFSLHCIIP